MPGRDIEKPREAHWYTWLKDKLDQDKIFKEVVIAEQMPDYAGASETAWVPWIKAQGIDAKSTVIVGHGSGAHACMRVAEEVQCKAMVICAANATDMGDAAEKATGYFDRPWQYEKMIENCGTIAQFSSDDDPTIPVAEARKIKEGLKLCVENDVGDYYEMLKRGHFDAKRFEEMFIVVMRLGVDDPDADPMNPVVPMPEGFEKTAVPKPLVTPKTLACVVLYFAFAYYYR